jgi:hypothetical protein
MRVRVCLTFPPASQCSIRLTASSLQRTAMFKTKEGQRDATAAYTKSKPRVRAYMIEHRAAVRERLVDQDAEGLRKLNFGRDQILARPWELGNLSHEATRGIIAGQIRALIIAFLDRDLVLQRGCRVMFRDRVRYHNGTRLLHSRDRRDAVKRQEVFGWVLVVVLGSACILSFSLLWLRANGGCGPHQALCKSAPYSPTDITPPPSSEGAPEF